MSGLSIQGSDAKMHTDVTGCAAVRCPQWPGEAKHWGARRTAAGAMTSGESQPL
jgi:hypothetical protein